MDGKGLKEQVNIMKAKFYDYGDKDKYNVYKGFLLYLAYEKLKNETHYQWYTIGNQNIDNYSDDEFDESKIRQKAKMQIDEKLKELKGKNLNQQLEILKRETKESIQLFYLYFKSHPVDSISTLVNDPNEFLNVEKEKKVNEP